MPKIAAAEKRVRTKQLASLIASGLAPEEAAAELGKEFKWSRHTRRRYINRVFAFWNRDKRLNRDAQLSRALATRDEILRRAMSRTVVSVVDEVDQATGKVSRLRKRLPDPDLQAALAAADSKARLLGLTAPDKLDLFAEGLGPIVGDMVDVLREDIADPVLLAKIIRRLRQRLEDGSSPRPKTIEATVTESRALPPAANG